MELIDKNGYFNIDSIPESDLSPIEISKLIYSFLNIPYIHIKTGNDYFLTNIAIECTNGHEDTIKCVYRNKKGIMFTRDFKEFFQKFKRE